eukprot:gene10798-10954_t
MALTTAVCCRPEIAQPLLAAGIHKEAVNQLKDGVKAMANHLVKIMELLDKDVAPHAWPAPPAHLLQALVPAVCAMVKPLLHLALASAASIFGTNASHCNSSSPAISKELCSMVVLNMSWVNLTVLLVAVPAGARLQVVEPRQVVQGLQCALQQLLGAVQELPGQPKDKQTVLLRFWLQGVSRLCSVAADLVPLPALQQLLHATVTVYACTEGDSFTPVLDVVEQIQLKQRLLACISATFIEDLHDSTKLQDKCCLLLDTENIICAVSNNLAGDVHIQHNQQDQQQEDSIRDQILQAHLLVVLDVMQQLPSMPAEVMQQCCVKLMTWTMEANGSMLGAVLLSSDIGGPVLLHMLQTLLYCLVSCGCVAPQQQSEVLRLHGQLKLPGMCQQHLDERLNHIWLTAQQLLVLHQLRWLLEAMQAVMRVPALHTGHSPSTAGSTKSCRLFCLEFVATWRWHLGARS